MLKINKSSIDLIEGDITDLSVDAIVNPANAQLLCERPEYSGDNFSYGDKYIKEMISQYDNPGSPTTWLKAGINHHMTFVVRQLATLAGTSTVALS